MVSSDDGPIFDNSLVTNVTAQLGGTAHLQCKVLNAKQDDHPVSFIHRQSLVNLEMVNLPNISIHLGGTQSQETGTSPPSCLLLDNRIYNSNYFTITLKKSD